jgi:hypothetical protein
MPLQGKRLHWDDDSDESAVSQGFKEFEGDKKLWCDDEATDDDAQQCISHVVEVSKPLASLKSWAPSNSDSDSDESSAHAVDKAAPAGASNAQGSLIVADSLVDLKEKQRVELGPRSDTAPMKRFRISAKTFSDPVIAAPLKSEFTLPSSTSRFKHGSAWWVNICWRILAGVHSLIVPKRPMIV